MTFLSNDRLVFLYKKAFRKGEVVKMLSIKEKIQDKKVIATKQEGDNQLGYIFWYSVTSDVEVTRIELQQHFNTIGIDEAWLPNEIRPSDAFRRATKEIQRKKVPTNNPNIFQNFLVREVYSDNKVVQRNIVIEEVDQSGKRLNYDPKATVMTLVKENNDFEITSDNTTAKELAMEAKQRFQKYIDYYSAQQLRVMVNKYLSSLAPTAVRANGGVYFVPQTYATELKKLQLLCKILQSEGVSIPLYDTTDNQNLVLSKLENDLQETLKRCKELSETDNLRKALYKDGIEEARRIVKTYQTYKENLQIDVEKFENTLNDLRLTAVTLTQKIVKK